MPDFYQIWLIVQVVLGIGLVIFVHESGHFVAARLCKVRVDVFSLGFGPRLFGWRRGATTYQVAAVPLGGYVKMAGDDSWPDDENQPSDSLGSKSVGQRFFIYSGGVIANVLFGLVVFPILFWVGVPFNEPVIGAPEAGGPAWDAGLQAGTRVLSVNGKPVYAFMHIPNDVALGSADECVLEVIEPGAEESRTVHLVPEYSEFAGIYTIGVYRAFDRENRIEVERGSPAEEAGLSSGDRLLSIEGGLPEQDIWEQFRAVLSDRAPLRARFDRGGEELAVTLVPRAAESAAYARIGVSAPTNHLFAIRASERTAGLDLRVDDRLLSVGGRPILRGEDLLRGLVESDGPIAFVLERGGDERRFELPPMSPRAALALADDLALRVDLESTLLVVSPDEPAARAGLRDGDRVLAISGKPIATYSDLMERSRDAAGRGRAMVFSILRAEPYGAAAAPFEVEVRPEPWHPLSYGFQPRPATYVYRVDSPIAAIQVGMVSCWKFLQDTWLTLKGMVVRKVSPKNVGGPIAIGVYAHSWAASGWTRLFFFLCMLSINLAFINVLPVPLLDGGHLMFLLIEKIKGSPVSYRVMSYSQVIGLVLIVSLFVFVIYNDVQHHILG